MWDYDPENLLEDERLNPEFVNHACGTLDEAVRAGLRPKVHQAYRSPEESDRLHKLFVAGKGSRASAAWQSCHNFGLAIDVWLYDVQGRYIDNHVKGWYKQYKTFAGISKKYSFVWGENFGSGDSDHFEYHPAWSGGAGGKLLNTIRDWALKAAGVDENNNANWIKYFWWAAGAGGKTPSQVFLAEHPLK